MAYYFNHEIFFWYKYITLENLYNLENVTYMWENTYFCSEILIHDGAFSLIFVQQFFYRTLTFIQQIFISTFYMPGILLSTGD